MFASSITVVDDVSADDLERLPLERLEAEVCSYAAHVSAGMCRWLLLVAECDRRGAHEKWGFPTMAHWLSFHCALNGRTARDHVRVARALTQLPVTTAAFASGELPFSKVRALTRVATPESEDELVLFARHATTAQLERTVAAYRRVEATCSPEQAKERHIGRYVNTFYDDEIDMHRGYTSLPAEEGEVVDAALDAAMDILAEEEVEAAGGSAEPPSARASYCQRRADALVMIAEWFLATRAPGQADTDADRYLVTVHADIGVLTGDDDVGRCHIENGPAISPDTLRRLGCTEPISLLVEDKNGNPLWMGRKVRTANRAQRRALAARHDGHCAYPGCWSTRRLVPHHVEEWSAHDGTTDIDNMVPICRRHHYLVHEGGYRVVRDGDAFRFLRPNGTEVIPRTTLPLDDLPDLTRGDPVVPKPASGDGDRLDLDLTLGCWWYLLHGNER